MKYMGSKNRHAKYLLPIILADRGEDQYYVEPFVGGGNMIDKVGGLRIGADSSWMVISALEYIRDCVEDMPIDNTQFTESDYRRLHLKESKIKGFAGFAYSYGGKWMGGWCRDGAGKRDYVAEAYRNAVKQSVMLRGIHLVCVDYSELSIPDRSIVYCDPPYASATKYAGTEFDHDAFWVWVRGLSCAGHSVFVSEYSAPPDFECVWEKEVHNTLVKDTGSKIGVEKLFVHADPLKGVRSGS